MNERQKNAVKGMKKKAIDSVFAYLASIVPEMLLLLNATKEEQKEEEVKEDEKESSKE